MKIKWKATIIVIVIILLSVSTANIAFGRFFLQYVDDQEKAQVDMIMKTVDTYFSERMIRYEGSVNDWAHWTDPYDFMNGEQPSFVEVNLAGESFQNLDINFMIFSNPDKTVKDLLYYSFEQEAFMTPSDEFLLSMDIMMHTAWLSDDVSCVMKINGTTIFLLRRRSRTMIRSCRPTAGY